MAAAKCCANSLVHAVFGYTSRRAGNSCFRPYQRRVVEEFSSPKRLGLPKPLLEAMILEGDPAREDVEDFVTGLLNGYENLVIS